VKEMTGNFADNGDFHFNLRIFLYIRDMGPTVYFPSKGRLAEDIFALKNPTASAGFEPANLGTRGQRATPRPPKLLLVDSEDDGVALCNKMCEL
jgi:hypothetical protein